MRATKIFTTQEKDACLPIVDLMLSASHTARIDGILGLEEWQGGVDSNFLKFILRLVVDGTDPAMVRDAGETLLAADDLNGADLLARMLMLEGALLVQLGVHPHIIEAKLLAMLGEKYLVVRGLCGGEVLPSPRDAVRQEALAAQEGWPSCVAFGEMVGAIPTRDISLILCEVDKAELAMALLGCSGAAALRLLAGCSARVASMVLDYVDLCKKTTPPEEVLRAQGAIIHVVKRLQDMQLVSVPPIPPASSECCAGSRISSG